MVEKKEVVDSVFKNGKVYVCDEKWTVAESFAINNGRFVIVGSNEEVAAKYTSENIVDLKGKCVYAGFIDAHCHIHELARDRDAVNLGNTKSFAEAVGILKEYHAHTKADIILGGKWATWKWTPSELPDRRLLDEAFPTTPVLLKDEDYHSLLVNSKVLEMAKLTQAIQIPGGQMVTYPDGRLTGLLIDKAMEFVKQCYPMRSPEKVKEQVVGAAQDLMAEGLTALCDAGLDTEQENINILQELHKEGRLKLRVSLMLKFSRRNIDEYLTIGTKVRTERLKVDSIKLFQDGTIPVYSAMLLQPYSDNPSTSGFSCLPQEGFEEVCELAMKHGYQVCTHAIGDGAVRNVLTTYIKHLKGPNERRWRIEHCAIVNPADYPLFGKYNIMPSMQPTHFDEVPTATLRLGKDRLAICHSLKAMLKAHGSIALGTDFPVAPSDPIY